MLVGESDTLSVNLNSEKEQMGSSATKLKVAIIGATGYAGQELVRILCSHPQVELCAITSHSYVGKKFEELFPSFRNRVSLVCEDKRLDELASIADLVFIALPHGEAARSVTSEILAKTMVVDLGADFRLKDPEQYKQWYHLEHASPDLLSRATYGLCELNREAISKSRLVANPGCYATASILALAPLLRMGLIDPASIIIDAKSGVSGAGRAATLGVHFNEVNESIKAYAIASHRHTPEIEQELSFEGGAVVLNFTPHLIPMNRGILVTAYASLMNRAFEPAVDPVPGVAPVTGGRGTANAQTTVTAHTTGSAQAIESVSSAFSKYFADSQFVRVTDLNSESAIAPETRWVKGSNNCEIGFKIDMRTKRVIVVAALDNLVKGAAGQAVQNMNLMAGYAEGAGLDTLSVFPG